MTNSEIIFKILSIVIPIGTFSYLVYKAFKTDNDAGIDFEYYGAKGFLIKILFGILAVGFIINFFSDKAISHKNLDVVIVGNLQDTIKLKNVEEYSKYFLILKDSSRIDKSKVVWSKVK